MDEIQKELLELVSQVRTHLEYQKALGVGFVETRFSPLSSLQEQPAGCALCPFKAWEKKKVTGTGNPGSSVLFILPHPIAGGASGQLLADIIVKGMKLRLEDVFITALVKCSLPDDHQVAPHEIENCELFLKEEILSIKPAVLVAFGDAAGLLLRKQDDFGSLRGAWQTYQGIPLMPTFHPTHLLEKSDDKKPAWEDIQKVMAEIRKRRGA